MKFVLFLSWMLLAGAGIAVAQPMYFMPQYNVWAIAARKGLDFNSGSPVSFTSAHAGFEGSASVCNAEGVLQFYTDGNRVWDRTHNLMPNGNAIVSTTNGEGHGTFSTTQGACIVPVIGSTSRYYLFSLEDKTGNTGRLFYSIIDMSLRNGLGDIVPGQKGILMDQGLTEKMVAVGGDSCNVWLIVHPRSQNAWKAYAITAAGISTTPVVSYSGLMASIEYYAGVIRISPDRKKMAAGSTSGQMELYDFDVATGTLSNPVALTTTSGANYRFYGMCFSPDNTRLYVTAWIGDLRQYDLTQPTAAAISQSETFLATTAGGFYNGKKGLGDIRLGPDGRIYVASFGRDSMHVIQYPNRLGAACQLDTFVIPTQLTVGGFQAGVPNDIGLPVPDTLSAVTTVCFWNKDSLRLYARDTSGLSYRWQDGTRGASLTVHAPGSYYISYSGNTLAPCTWYVDTFRVIDPAVPSYGAAGSCPGLKEGKAWCIGAAGDTTTFRYRWEDASGAVLRDVWSNAGDTLSGLNPGDYRVHIAHTMGCDTAFSITVDAYPAPEASFTISRDRICAGDTVMLRNTSPDPFLSWHWYLGDGTGSDRFSVSHRYDSLGDYEVALVMGLDQCSDTARGIVHAGDFRLSLYSDKQLYDPGEEIHLYTQAGEAYTIDKWSPERLFGDQQSYEQYIKADSSRGYMVWGRSSYGCPDSAEVSVRVDTKLFMPSAFTPDGDGKNDYFRPFHVGDPFTVRLFAVYDRWGKLVWSGNGAAGVRGWDGTYGGTPAEVGTYFYRIEMETASGRTDSRKGDVTLIR